MLSFIFNCVIRCIGENINVKIVYLIKYNNSIYHDLLQEALKGNGFYTYESAKAKLDDQIQIA